MVCTAEEMNVGVMRLSASTGKIYSPFALAIAWFRATHTPAFFCV